MAIVNVLGFSAPRLEGRGATNIERLVVQRPLNRILAFIGRDIDAVVNDPIVKGQVRGYFKLEKDIQRQSEIAEMERAWNSLGMRF
jgi:hypothetical protein